MKFRLLSVPLLVLLSACGRGGDPTSPTSTPPPAPVNGTVLTFVSGDLDVGITGAVINVAGQPAKVTDSTGEVAFDQVLSAGLPYDAMASGYLPRNSILRSLANTRLSLWPVRAGLDETFTQQMVYNEFMPGRRLSRPAQSVVHLRLSPEIAGDPQARETYEQAARVITAATRERIQYLISDNSLSGIVAYDISVNQGQPAGGLTTSTFSGNRIMGGKIEYRSLSAARVFVAALHELGHTLGLGHPTAQSAVMNPAPANFVDYTTAEKLIIDLMLQRNPGTVYPDNDRNSQALGNARTTITIQCGH